MEEDQKKKIVLIQTVAIIVAAVILVAWALNLKNVWQSSQLPADTASNAQWNNLKNNLNQTLADMQTQLDRLQAAANSASTSSTTGQAFLSDLMKKTASSSAAATAITTVTPTLVAPTSPSVRATSSCPAYINCMPQVVPEGAKRTACQVPAGCEGITQLVY